MHVQFSQAFLKFRAKIQRFIISANFKEKSAEYAKLFNRMASVTPDDMKHYIEKSPAFLNARNKSLACMERIVVIHKELEALFEMDEITVLKYRYDLKGGDELIGKISKEGRKAIALADDPFYRTPSRRQL